MKNWETLNPNDISIICNVKEQEVHWLWEPFIPRGKVTIIQGDPGEGKSMFAAALCASVSHGMNPAGEHVIDVPHPVLLFNAEDGLADTVTPRLRKAGADLGMIATYDDSNDPLTLRDGRIVEMVEMLRPSLVVIDPIQAYLGEYIDMHRANEIRPAMAHLAHLAEKYDVSIVLIGHMNKMSGKKAIYRGLGSIDVTAAARSVLLIAKDPDHPKNRVIAQIKNSLHEMAAPVAFTLDDEGKFQYLGEYEISMAKLLAEADTDVRPSDKAVELLQKWLTEYPEISAREIYLMAEGEDISKATLKRAKARLHIRAKQKQDGWYWSLPKFGVIGDLFHHDSE